MIGLVGRKVGMTRIFNEDGVSVPVTVIEIEANRVTQVKTLENDGYTAVQVTTGSKKANRVTKPEAGHFVKAGVEAGRGLWEFRTEGEEFTLGQEINVDIFADVKKVDVTGTSKGKGFQGVIKRHNQSRGPMSHGSQYHRGVGSMGTLLPMRVLPGKKLPGHMGHEQVTIQNLEVISVDLENNVILIKGSVPGPKNSLVLVRTSVKTGDKVNEPVELVVYEEGVTSEEVAEETMETINEELASVETSQETAE